MIPSELRIGHLTYRVIQDDKLIAEQSVRAGADYGGWSSAPTQTIALGSKALRLGNEPLGEQYRRETLLHEVLHCCLTVAGCDPDRDAKAGVDDVEERAVNSMAGPLLAVLRDNPDLLAYLLEGSTSDED